MSTAEMPRPARRIARPRPQKPSARPQPVERHEASEPALADFIGLKICAIDAEKWPVSPVLWWQPELLLRLPQTSGLRNERRYKTPVGGFLNVDSAPVCAAGAVLGPKPVVPRLPVRRAGSDLTVLGWDPRTRLGKARE